MVFIIINCPSRNQNKLELRPFLISCMWGQIADISNIKISLSNAIIHNNIADVINTFS